MTHARTLWEEGQEPGRQVVALGAALALTVVVIDLMLMGRVSLLFDLCFVALCIGLALAVRPRDFFIVGVLPPLIMLGVFALLGLTRPAVIAASPGRRRAGGRVRTLAPQHRPGHRLRALPGRARRTTPGHDEPPPGAGPGLTSRS